MIILKKIFGIAILAFSGSLSQNAVPEYIESLLDNNSTLAEYFICANALQSNRARSVLEDIESYVTQKGIEKRNATGIVDKIFVRAALSCITTFGNLSREKKLSLLNMTMESTKKDHLDNFFIVDHKEILELGEFELNDEEREYKENVTKIQEKQRKEREAIQQRKKQEKQGFNITETAEELKRKNKRLEKIIKEKIQYVETDKMVHHGILYGIIASIIPTLFCHYCFFRSKNNLENEKEEIESLKIELRKEGKIYTKEFDDVEKKRKNLKEAVQKKFNMKIDEFLEKKRHEKELKDKNQGVEEEEVENLKERK